jgi:hypothetical protein
VLVWAVLPVRVLFWMNRLPAKATAPTAPPLSAVFPEKVLLRMVTVLAAVPFWRKSAPPTLELFPEKVLLAMVMFALPLP